MKFLTIMISFLIIMGFEPPKTLKLKEVDRLEVERLKPLKKGFVERQKEVEDNGIYGGARCTQQF